MLSGSLLSLNLVFPLVCRSGALSLTRLCTLSPFWGGFPSLMGSGAQEG